MTGPNKGPQGKDDEGDGEENMIGCQEEYEGGEKVDLKDGNFTQDPFSLRAPESDHTPNHTRGPKPAKTEYGKFSTGRFGL